MVVLSAMKRTNIPSPISVFPEIGAIAKSHAAPSRAFLSSRSDEVVKSASAVLTCFRPVPAFAGLDLARGPHAPGQRDWRHPAFDTFLAPLIPVGAQRSGRSIGRAEAPVHALRHVAARLSIAVERCELACRQLFAHAVAAHVFAADSCVPFVCQLRPPISPRAMTCAWISAAPSKILRIRASQRMRLISYSSA